MLNSDNVFDSFFWEKLMSGSQSGEPAGTKIFSCLSYDNKSSGCKQAV